MLWSRDLAAGGCGSSGRVCRAGGVWAVGWGSWGSSTGTPRLAPAPEPASELLWIGAARLAGLPCSRAGSLSGSAHVSKQKGRVLLFLCGKGGQATISRSEWLCPWKQNRSGIGQSLGAKPAASQLPDVSLCVLSAVFPSPVQQTKPVYSC